MSEAVRTGHSICPVCKKRLPAEYVRRGDDIYLEKSCPEHGSFSVIAWRGEPDFSEWCGKWEDSSASAPSCPEDCGLCAEHRNKTCCAILDVTQRCDLGCPLCFAASGTGADMSLDEVFHALEDMFARGIRFLHLSGGEPTVRDDLPIIAERAVALGYEYIQLNTNGLRLANEKGYAELLRDAGISSVFLQFDGTNDNIYKSIRGRELLEIKKRAIAACDEAELGVMLVPTVIPGVNDGDIGNIIRFAFDNMPAVKGVHFQPVTYLGRYFAGEKRRLTMPELLRAIESQSGGLVKVCDFSPSACDSPLCGFHGEFRRRDGALIPLFEKSSCCCSGETSGVEGNQNHVKNRWTRIRRSDCKPGSLDAFLRMSNERSFCVSAMAFQDEENLDLGRLMRCSVHVYSGGKMIPFCAYHTVYK